MKIAQELRAGNVVMIGKDPMVVQKAEFSKSGRNASVVKMKLKNLLTGAGTERFTAPTTSSKRSTSTARNAPIPTSPIRCMFSWTANTTSMKSKAKTSATR
jgi:translation elongation factor P/translation initiation factor 5A